MKDAIWNSNPPILCHYEYYPLFISLTSDEMEQYNKVTEQLRKFIDPKTGKYKKEAEMKLMERKRIIHKAANKKLKVAELLDQQKEKGCRQVFGFPSFFRHPLIPFRGER